ncbi:ABC transporter ATP-binding protein [Capnocytophaga sputigena]|jgi:methionine import ATP-binding protein metN 1|uniref:ABC transporter ATP-binding protein n=1 Tax=Capnocytophaga sputigena TaxID=1019 RepID=UPI000F706EE6|nr:ATP-binding cassette domain-containing protein [Capnocytophaga sputigena]VEI55872.1 Fe(3+) ions import ATP-binding protein FbpC [Capnocytophaga sputigena]
MKIKLQHLKPTYMSGDEIPSSDIYLQPEVIFEQGQYYLIRAQSGQGKTSLLNFIYGASFSYDGKITYDDAFSKKDVLRYRIDKLSYVYQDLRLFPTLTAFENIILKNKLTHYKTEDQINSLIERVGLSHKRDTLVQTLSLGQRQRIALLRALCQPFELLLLDEPFSHLDDSNTTILREIIGEELQARNASLLLTSLEDNNFFHYNKKLNLGFRN